MITIHNYFDKVQHVDLQSLPEALRKGHDFVSRATSNGVSWDTYHASEAIKKTIDTYFEKLTAFVGKGKAGKSHSKNTEQKEHSGSRKQKAVEPAHSKPKSKPDLFQPSMVERIPDELRFIRRFVNLNGRPKSKDDILRFVNSLQKAILEKRVRKTSPHVEHIRFIQDKLIEAYNNMGKTITISLKPETFEALKKAANDEKVMSSVNFIKRYINLNGKLGMKEKARLLLGQINRAYEQGKINDRDPYVVEMHEIKKNLENFLSEKTAKFLEIEKSTLNGLEGIINGCSCQNLNGFDGEGTYETAGTKPLVMNSMDFANMRFNTLGLKGKWLQLIGDPSTNFSIMVYGKPKMGKSYLCVDFAGYLARTHGKVLYVAREEGLDKTLQDKLNDKDVKHPNLYVASTIPASLAFYDFIFLDSVNRLGLKPDDLNRLRAMYPEKSFVFVFQTTKEGKFKGANTFQHDVDSVIEVPEKGKAVQYGRFNAGGEISIF